LSSGVELLVTGFGPFAGIEDNPSSWLAERSGFPYEILPVSFRAVDEFLVRCMAAAPRKLLMLGVAAGRKQLTPEIFAWNHIGAAADVDGETRPGEIEDGEAFCRVSNLWQVPQLARWVLSGTCGLSGTPGNYLCNFCLYRALGMLPGTRIGFLHVPGDAHMDREQMQIHLSTILRDVE